MFIKIIYYLMINEITTMRSIKRKNEDIETQRSSKQSRSEFQNDLRDGYMSAYGNFLDPSGRKFFESDCISAKKTNSLSYKTNVVSQEPMQKHEEYLQKTLNYKEGGRPMTDKFWNQIEDTAVNENSGSTLHKDILSESSTPQIPSRIFEQNTTLMGFQKAKNIYDELYKPQNLDNNGVASFLPHFNTIESTKEQNFYENSINHVDEYVFTPQETFHSHLNERTFNYLSNTDVEYSSCALSTDLGVSKDIEEQLQLFNNILEMVKKTRKPEPSSEHSIHETIDAQIIDEIMFINNEKKPISTLEQKSPIEHDSEGNFKNFFDQEQYSTQTLNVSHSNFSSNLDHTETTEGSFNAPVLRSVNYLPISNINSILIEPSSECNTSVDRQGEIPSTQPNYNFLNTNEVASRIPETSSQSVAPDLIEIIHSKVVQFISKTIRSFSSNPWHLERIDGIRLLINHIKNINSDKLIIIRSFITLIDEKIMLVLDKLNLRNFSELKKYELKDYNDFICALKCAFNKNNLYIYMAKYNKDYKENVLPILCTKFILLFSYFPEFPELMTLGSLFNQGGDEDLILYVRIIYLILSENIHRLEQIKTVILFIIKKSFLTPYKKPKKLNIKILEKFIIKKHFNDWFVCEEDHSNLSFFLWEFCSKKISDMRHSSKIENGYIYDINVSNIAFFKVVLQTFLFQHIMFTEYYNLSYSKYEKLLEASLNVKNCVFCLFNGCLDFIRSDTQTNPIKL